MNEPFAKATKALVAVLMVGGVAWGTTYTTPSLDGATGDWDADESIDAPQNIYGTGNYQLLVTWDATNLYIGMDRNASDRYLGDTGWDNDSFFVAIDTNPGTAGSGASADAYGRLSFGNNDYRPDHQYSYAGGGGWYEYSNWSGSAWSYSWSDAGTYYGWQEANPNDELTIPWSTLGNPSSIGLYAWMTREGNAWIEAVWPQGGNGTGSNPTLSNCYIWNSLGAGVSPNPDKLMHVDDWMLY